MEGKITVQMKRLLYMIGNYTKQESEYGKLVLKDLPLKGLIFKGIIDKIFDYDYAPQSIFYIDNRRYVNVSQEGEDDLNDLRELGLLKKIRLATRRHFYIYSYTITRKGAEYIELIPDEDKQEVDRLIKCNCGKLFDVIVKKTDIYMRCAECGNMMNTEISEIEDVSYVCVPVQIVTALTKRKKIGTCVIPWEDEQESTLEPKVLPKEGYITSSQKKEDGSLDTISRKSGKRDEWWKKQRYVDASKYKRRDKTNDDD
ncbi:MAG: hypothetical protein EAX96_14555 [Candidatus Lokiarchaeota archaeon]|nr:hypothetical protein [Candidatus Lokiarchaeota archaeon]